MFELTVSTEMIPQATTPDWAIQRMKIITKYDDPELLDAALELLAALSDDRGQKGDAARAALDYGYRKTADCDRRCQEYLGLAV